MHHTNKGIIGLFIQFTDDVEIVDVDITQLHIFSDLGSSLCGEYDGPGDPGVIGFAGEGFMGNDARAVLITDAENLDMQALNIKQIFSESGKAIGIDVLDEATNIVLSDINICEVASFLDVPDGVDLPLPNENPSACGVTVSDTSTAKCGCEVVTVGALSAEEPCDAEFATLVDEC
eukprot:TRINITY_DN4396_c0_g1_i1.p1 TRINITY_DN4396_c0_g1~~TRINITY_DN4396_c0_g1_i1.p1  ORF type:complete len:176 (-),score=39.53 TRINITY_DN4396_c0_g1_i1:167-694(-)